MTTRTATIRLGSDYCRIVGEYPLTKRLLGWQKAGLTYTATGYGKRIPTSWVIDFQGRTRRIYCTIYSNNGTCWFVAKGVKYIVD